MGVSGTQFSILYLLSPLWREGCNMHRKLPPLPRTQNISIWGRNVRHTVSLALAMNRPPVLLYNLKIFDSVQRYSWECPAPAFIWRVPFYFPYLRIWEVRFGKSSPPKTAVHCHALVMCGMPVLPDCCAARYSQRLAAWISSLEPGLSLWMNDLHLIEAYWFNFQSIPKNLHLLILPYHFGSDSSACCTLLFVEYCPTKQCLFSRDWLQVRWRFALRATWLYFRRIGTKRRC